MQQLATCHWNRDEKSSASCRIQWVKKQCHDYFLGEGENKYFNRENDILTKIIESSTNKITQEIKTDDSDSDRTAEKSKIKLLDVGSCYNPFGDDESLEVTAIDLAPYSNLVYQCDFLNVSLGFELIITHENNKILQLKNSSFDVIVFSLFLEYLPSPEQRFQCCQKAYQLLRPGGILIIITPDSKHVNANANIIKSWRFVLSKMGFMRICYEKLQHIHCITYRKCFNVKVASRWADMQNFQKDTHLFESISKLFIPQDFNASVAIENKPLTHDKNEPIEFDELPPSN